MLVPDPGGYNNNNRVRVEPATTMGCVPGEEGLDVSSRPWWVFIEPILYHFFYQVTHFVMSEKNVNVEPATTTSCMRDASDVSSWPW